MTPRYLAYCMAVWIVYVALSLTVVKYPHSAPIVVCAAFWNGWMWAKRRELNDV